MYTIRPAKKADAARCAAIYAPYTEGAITYEYPAPDAAEIARRMEEVTAAYPWLVCERDGEVIGYAYAHRFRERMAFDWTVEMSIYLDRDALGGGIGTALYSALIELLAALGYVNAIGTVATPNPPSERLHEKCGFERLFCVERIGWKMGEWRDMTYYMLRLNPPEGKPAPARLYPGLGAGYVACVCAKHAAAIREARHD